MKRVVYLLKDEVGEVKARWALPEEAHPTLDPWMIHGVRTKGWRMEGWERSEDSGVQIHGWADWQGVSDNLAAVVRAFLADIDPDDPVEEEHRDFLDAARAALDDYAVAEMEVNVAAADADPQIQTDENGEADG